MPGITIAGIPTILLTAYDASCATARAKIVYNKVAWAMGL